MNNKRQKDTKLQHSEYYGMQEIYDNLYQQSSKRQKFILHLLENVPSDIARVDFSTVEQEKKQAEEKAILGTYPKCNHGEVK